MAPLDDGELMDVALAEAARAAGWTSPNPVVGAVVARDGEVISTGFHRGPGEAHAEVVALAAAGERARGADLFVTLEPCTRQGRTPPCAPAVVEASPRRVVVAMLDPNPDVSGAGVAALRDAGIDVAVGLGGEAAERLNRHYLTWRRRGRPFVTLKFAASLDGRIATRTGESRWISSPESRRLAHQLRAGHDAVMVGAGTVARDDPALTVRLDEPARQPLRVVVDSRLRTPPSARLFAEDGGPVLLAATDAALGERRSALTAAGAEVLTLPARDGRVDLGALLAELARREVTSVLAEGGAALLGSLRDAGLVDGVVAILAPRLLGGAAAPGALGGEGVAELADSVPLTDVSVERCGGDVVVTGYAVPEMAAGTDA